MFYIVMFCLCVIGFGVKYIHTLSIVKCQVTFCPHCASHCLRHCATPAGCASHMRVRQVATTMRATTT